MKKQLCSLNPGEDRLAFSVEWELDSSGEVVSEWMGRSVIRSCCKLTYGMAQRMIEGVDDGGGERPLHGEAHSWPAVAGDVRALHALAVRLRAERFAAGALRLDNARLSFELGEVTLFTLKAKLLFTFFKLGEVLRLIRKLAQLSSQL